MKKALLVAAIAIALIVWVISWFRVPEAVAKSAAQEWPAGLGTLASLPAQLPPVKANDASVKLTALANALPKNEVIENFVTREIASGELMIAGPPTLSDVSAMRELLLHEPVVWHRPGGVTEIGDSDTIARRIVQITIARALIASALQKARANDAAAWEDLHAVWNLAGSMNGQPQMMSQTAAFAMVRMINAAAWKMPLPAPAWFGDLQQRDDLRPLLAAFQYQVASYWYRHESIFPTKFLADSVDHDRRIAESVSKETRCDAAPPMNELGVDVAFVWRRAFRYRAEREATANALRIREAKPIDARSRCSDGAWTFDGKTLRFTRAIPTSAPDKPMPLELRF